MAFGHFLLSSHNFSVMVTAPGSCVKWPLCYPRHCEQWPFWCYKNIYHLPSFFFYKTRIPLCCALVESPPLSILQFCTLLLWREDKSVELNGSWKVCKWELKPVFGIHKIWWQSSFWALDCSFNLKIYEENRSNNRGCYTSFFPFSISREWGRGMLSLKGGGLNFQKYRGSKGGSFHF